MSSRLQFTVLLICTALWFSCSPPVEEPETDPSIPKKISNLEPRNAEPEPDPIPQLVILFEFEGIPQSTLNAWIGDRNLKLIQRQLELNDSGLPTEQADLYILSPRLITQFIEKDLVSRWDPAPDLSEINPIFTSHSFDFKNQYTIPWRWTPMILMEHLPDAGVVPAASADQTPSFPDDPVMIAALQSLPKPEVPVVPSTPSAEAYRVAWESFKSSKSASIWIPAACPIRNTSDYTNLTWKWSLPNARSTIVFDHLLLGAQSKLKPEASELMEYLLSSDEQNFLITTSGYLPVICPLGKETHSSPIPMPSGNWLNNSSFISLPAYTPPPATEPAETEKKSEETNGAPAPEPSPAPVTAPQDQTAY